MQKETKEFFMALLLVSTILGGVGQLLLKIGISNPTHLALGTVGLVGFIVLGFIAYVASSGFYLYVLGRMHLSWAYGFGGISYIAATILAMLVLSEAVSPLRWAGIIIIAIGTALVGLS